MKVDEQAESIYTTEAFHVSSSEGEAARQQCDLVVEDVITIDIDGDSRDAMPDLGADERVGAGTGIYLPIILKEG